MNNHRGWISDESVKFIAQELMMSPAEVDAVATYYSRIYRKPVGRNIILVCDSVSCLVMGYETIYKYISKKLNIIFGETTKDNRYTLLPITCLGDCDHAPSMMINDDLYNMLTVEKIDELLDKY